MGRVPFRQSGYRVARWYERILARRPTHAAPAQRRWRELTAPASRLGLFVSTAVEGQHVGTARTANRYFVMRKKPGEFARLTHECENFESRVEDEAVRKTYGDLAAHWRKLAAQEERVYAGARKKPERRTWYASRHSQRSSSVTPHR